MRAWGSLGPVLSGGGWAAKGRRKARSMWRVWEPKASRRICRRISRGRLAKRPKDERGTWGGGGGGGVGEGAGGGGGGWGGGGEGGRGGGEDWGRGFVEGEFRAAGGLFGGFGSGV